MPKIVFILSNDSYVKPAIHIQKLLKQNAIELKVMYVNEGENKISSRQLANLKIDFYSDISVVEYIIKDFDIIFLGLGGGLFFRLNRRIKKKYPNKKIIALFPGICHYKKNKAFMYRACADLILFNSKKDFHFYKFFGRIFGLSTLNSFHSGLVYLIKNKRRILAKKKSDVKTVTFIEQEIIPYTYSEKKYILDNLIILARYHNDKVFYIKPRTIGSEVSAHKSKNKLSVIFKEYSLSIGNIPPNLFFTDESVENCIDMSDLIISVSSTVLLEAIYKNKVVVSLNDFEKNKKYSTEYFSGSLIQKTFSELKELPSSNYIDINWYDDNIRVPERVQEYLVKEILSEKLCANNFSYVKCVIRLIDIWYLISSFFNKRCFKI